jgi:superfamily II DNA or RNA helicase
MQKWIEIQLSTHFILDFWLEPNTVARTPQYKDVPVLEEDRWPSKDELGLDESQYEALKIALTKEVAVIQGPPGTGKTFIGLKV